MVGPRGELGLGLRLQPGTVPELWRQDCTATTSPSQTFSTFHTCTAVLNLSRRYKEEVYLSMQISKSVAQNIKWTLPCQLPCTKTIYCPIDTMCNLFFLPVYLFPLFCYVYVQIHGVLVSTQQSTVIITDDSPSSIVFSVGENVSDVGKKACCTSYGSVYTAR